MNYFAVLCFGLFITMKVAVLSLIFGLMLSFLFSFLLRAQNKYVWAAANTLLNTIRGIPEIIIILFIYYGTDLALSKIMGESIHVDPIYTGVFSLSLLFTGYVSQVFVDGSNRIDNGQMRAARSLGMNAYTAFWHIRWNQFWRYVLPGVGNNWLVLLKDTALLSLIGLQDFFSQAQFAAKNSNDYFYYYVVSLVVYLLLTGMSDVLLSKLKYHLDKPWRTA